MNDLEYEKIAPSACMPTEMIRAPAIFCEEDFTKWLTETTCSATIHSPAESAFKDMDVRGLQSKDLESISDEIDVTASSERLTAAAPDKMAAIDIGTNSIHLVVAKTNGNHRFEIITREKEVVRLGSGAKDMKYLQTDVMDRAIETLIRYRQIAEMYGARIRAVATSAVREALNQSVFLEKALKEAGMEVEVISGFEEARLIYLGILQALPVFDRKVLLIDIGGGSTEFLVGQAGEVLRASSLKLGAIRLTNHFFKGDVTDEQSIAKCRQHLKTLLYPMARELRRFGYDSVVGSSGTILNLAQMIQVSNDQEPSRLLNNYTFKKSDLSEIIKTLVKADTLKKRQRIGGLDQQRADIILGGALLLEEVFDAFKFDSITVSGYALREGVLFDSAAKSHGENRHHLSDIRCKGVLQLAETCRYEKEHADQVTRLALQIYDQLRGIHKLADLNREYLEAAAILHDVGYFISHAQHHRHSYYLIRNSEFLMGFTSREIDIIALVARYHRKSGPKQKHAEFTKLTPKDQNVVKALASILRLADGLDRTHSGTVKSVRCHAGRDQLNLHLETQDGAMPSLEIYMASMRRGLFEETFGKSVNFLLS